MIGVIDYNCGNLASLSQALISLGAPHRLISSAEQFTDMNAIILPGVGHFGHAVRNLDGLKLREPILKAIQQGIPLLGICLGMQLLLDTSAEADHSLSGLGVIPGKVESLRDLGVTGRVPHIGWNTLRMHTTNSKLLAGICPTQDVYFVHSFAAVPTDISHLSATTDHCNVNLTAAVEADNVYGTQFHPEKSSAIGKAILKNFISLTC
jgi:imidazole glycerol-phosphate synthase subunit HisH